MPKAILKSIPKQMPTPTLMRTSMPTPSRRDPAAQTPAATVAAGVIQLRTTIRWSQRELSRRSGVPQSMISRIEGRKLRDVSLATANRLLETMGARLRIEIDAPYLSDRQRQIDPAHARMSGRVTRRLVRAGWEVASEVEVGGNRSRGWIDLLAIRAATGQLLVIELKTEIHDLGQIDRTLGWYEREAWAAARRLDWRPRAVTGCLLLLMTEANDAAVAFNREVLRRLFTIRATVLQAAIDGARPLPGGCRALGLVDPRSHRRGWVRSTRLDGRRTPAAYVDYADFMRASLVHPRPRAARRQPGGS